MHRYCVITLGCKVNQYDGAAIEADLMRRGLRPVDRPGPGDLLVVNTCCVTRQAMRKSRQALRKALRAAPDARVLITGCYADFDPHRLREALDQLGVPHEHAAICGHHRRLDDCLDRLADTPPRIRDQDQTASASPQRRPGPAARKEGRMREAARSASFTPDSMSTYSIRASRAATVKANHAGIAPLEGIDRFPRHQRAFVKVQDGCDAFCAYCIVCYTRPVVRSRPAEEVLDECRRLLDAGHRELVLCGVFLGAYGRDTAIRRRWDPRRRQPLAELLARVADLDGLWRVRLSSLEPGDVTDPLVDLYAAHPAVAPHLHLPLQSGSPDILRRMNRQYTPDDYLRAADRLRDALDRPALTADVIAGFPGESDADFQQTLQLVDRAGLCRVHAFPFSAIPETTAWAYRHQAPPGNVVRARLDRLASQVAEQALAYRKRFVGETVEALVEADRPNPGLRQAMTPRYQPIVFPHSPDADDLTGTVVRRHIDRVTDTGWASG
jgi:threonylcarbamoyladenosine tRNA methylthiotransferase MtaB